MPITAVIAEDEPILRAQLNAKLAKLWPELVIVADVGDGEAALEAIDEHRPSLAFLDIQMPEMTGVEVARSLAANRELRCHVVFVTAFDQYAVEAFETDAVDYVLKPYSDERLKAAVDRLQARLGSVPPAPPQDLEALLARLTAKLSTGNEQLKWIKASVGQNLRLIPIEEVLFFQSDEKYTLVATAEFDALIRTPIKEILEGILQIAREHGLIVFADEIYDKVLFDGNQHISLASLADDVLCITMNGLSKNYRACGYRAGWMVVSGDKRHAKDYIEGLNMLASMRLCANVPGQMAIQTALGGYQSINDLIGPNGRLTRQRDLAWKMLTEIPGVTCVKPKGALYLFPKLDPKMYPIKDDEQFMLELLKEEKVLLVQGSGFNWPHPDHFRVVFLPHENDLAEAIGRVARFLDHYRRRMAKA